MTGTDTEPLYSGADARAHNQSVLQIERGLSPLITLSEARTVVHHALQYAREQELPPMTIAVLDASGSLVAFVREDRSSLLRERIARGRPTAP